jgi:hypothetical protein
LFGFSVATTLPDRADGMKNESRGQISGRSYDGVSGGTAFRIFFGGLAQNLWPAGLMNRARHTTSVRQSAVGGIDDRVNVLSSDIALNKFQSTWAQFNNHGSDIFVSGRGKSRVDRTIWDHNTTRGYPALAEVSFTSESTMTIVRPPCPEEIPKTMYRASSARRFRI